MHQGCLGLPAPSMVPTGSAALPQQQVPTVILLASTYYKQPPSLHGRALVAAVCSVRPSPVVVVQLTAFGEPANNKDNTQPHPCKQCKQ